MRSASIEDWFEINALFTRFTTALDRGDLDGVAGCFTEDGFIASPLMGDFRGHPEIRAFAERTARAARERAAQFRHVVSNLIAVTDGDRAHATCYLLDYMTADGKTELLSPGEYDCDLARVGGKWLFTERRITLDQPFPVKL
jgi:ketosteroid isomerase-like protein